MATCAEGKQAASNLVDCGWHSRTDFLNTARARRAHPQGAKACGTVLTCVDLWVLILSLHHMFSIELGYMCGPSTAKAKLTSTTAGRVQLGQDSLALSQVFGWKRIVKHKNLGNVLWRCMR